MMAAISASEAGWNVTLIEKNEKLGKKLFITGKGRCNVTNDCEASVFFDNVVSNPKFMYSAYYSFDNNMVMDMLESLGCRLKVERGNRVFPVSDHSSDIIRTLENKLKSEHVKVLLNKTLNDIVVREGKVTGAVVDGKTLECDRLILATGGKSYPQTGSDGKVFDILKSLGHSLTFVKPALVPLTVKDEWVYNLQGLALKNVAFTLEGPKQKTIFSDQGEMLFTHFGISGPLILSASSLYSKKAFGQECMGYIDLKPALTPEMLDKRLLRDFESNNNKALKNSLDALLPKALIPVVIELSGNDPFKQVNLVTSAERERLRGILKKLPLHITGTRGFSEAIITQGGINVKEVDPSTMGSKLIEGLYLTGEMLDLDAYTGGFNLQIAWSTGHLAGIS